jgi:hypothetical protein
MVEQRKRNRWIPALVTVGAVLALGCILLVVGGAYWWQQNGMEVSAEVQAARREGEAAAHGNSYGGCLDQATARIKDLPGPKALLIGNSFLGGCMETATEPPGFCDVPSDGFGIRRWRQQRCEAVPADAKDSCEVLIGSVQKLCTGHRAPKS